MHNNLTRFNKLFERVSRLCARQPSTPQSGMLPNAHSVAARSGVPPDPRLTSAFVKSPLWARISSIGSSTFGLSQRITINLPSECEVHTLECEINEVSYEVRTLIARCADVSAPTTHRTHLIRRTTSAQRRPPPPALSPRPAHE